MTSQPKPSDEERAQLVAYLDGELSDGAAREVEAKIGRDPRARAEADALERTWELLDYLPRPEPSQNFTQRTLERVSALRLKAPRKPLRLRPWAVGIGWAAAVFLAATAGYTAVTTLAPRTPPPDDEELVRDLRVIENKRLYESADDLDFLRQLDHPDRFGDDNLES